MKHILLFFGIALLLSCGSNSTGNKNTSPNAPAPSNPPAQTGSSENSVPAPATTPPVQTETDASNSFTIKGKIANAPSQQVSLDKYSITQSQQPVTNTMTSSDGSFSFNGKINEKGLYLIRLNNNVNWLIVLDKGMFTFSADANDIYKHTMTGSPETEAFSSFIVKAGQKQLSLNQLNQQFNAAKSTGQMQQMLNVQQQYQTKYTELQTYLRSTIETSQYPLVSVFAASLMNMEDNSEYLDAFIAKANPSPYINELKQKIDMATKLAMGHVAPDIQLKSPKGENIKLSAMRGKVVLLDFWASWCRPCRNENPNVVRLYDKYHSKGFEVFSVSLDQNLDKWVGAIQADNLKWKNHGSTLQGWQCPVAATYEIHSIPNTFLLDKNGKIIGKNLRGADLENKLRELFGA